MVCPRCIHAVKQILLEMGIPFTEVNLGYATLKTNELPDLDRINEKLEKLELGLIRNQNALTVKGITEAARSYMENINLLGRKEKLSDYISKELGKNYHQLSKLYSQYCGITIEQYFIDLRTNKVKELIKQGELNFSQIAITVGCSSIYYLSGQFKKCTGLSLTEYRTKWEEEVRKSFTKAISEKPVPDECGCRECHCGEAQAELPKEIGLAPLDLRTKGSYGLGRMHEGHREYNAFVNL
tara:strand:- start:122 stop:841 length:720 start_codon:yes stop_codon:yes gene_type:complete